MSNPKILVTTAAGKTGNATARQLLEKGYPVRAFVRSDDHRANSLRAAGAEIFVGDMNDMEDLLQAMAGCQRAYFVMPLDDGNFYKAMSFAVAAADSKLEVVVMLGQWLSQSQHPSVWTRETYLTDRIMSWIPNVDTVIINVGWFADNYMAVMEPVAQLGIFPYPLGEGRTAPVSNEDIARVNVGVLTNPGPHIGRTYRPVGPELLDPHQLADVFAKVLGRKVTYQNMSSKMFSKALAAVGFPIMFNSQLRYYTEEYRRGAFEAGVPNNVVREIGGRDPEDFETIVRRYVAADPKAKRTMGNKARAIIGFMKILATRAPDLEAYEAAQPHPLLRKPKYALDSELWTKTHNVPNAFGLESPSTVGTQAAPRLAINHVFA